MASRRGPPLPAGRDPDDPEPRPVPAPLRHARVVARLMDRSIAIPGTRFRFGLDPVLGLIPGVGDWLGLVVSSHLIVAAIRLGAPASVLTRMIGRTLVDALVGAVPLAGDVFDVFWKANARNLALLEAHLADPVATRRTSRRTLALLATGAVGLLGGLAWAGWALLRAVLSLLGA